MTLYFDPRLTLILQDKSICEVLGRILSIEHDFLSRGYLYSREHTLIARDFLDCFLAPENQDLFHNKDVKALFITIVYQYGFKTGQDFIPIMRQPGAYELLKDETYREAVFSPSYKTSLQLYPLAVKVHRLLSAHSFTNNASFRKVMKEVFKAIGLEKAANLLADENFFLNKLMAVAKNSFEGCSDFISAYANQPPAAQEKMWSLIEKHGFKNANPIFRLPANQNMIFLSHARPLILKLVDEHPQDLAKIASLFAPLSVGSGIAMVLDEYFMKTLEDGISKHALDDATSFIQLLCHKDFEEQRIEPHLVAEANQQRFDKH